MDKKNQFHPDTIKAAADEKVVREKKIKEKLEKAVALGQKCLANPDFRKYRDNYKKLEVLIVDAWLCLEEPDPMKYTVEVRGMALQLHQLRLLLNSVTKDAEKKNG